MPSLMILTPRDHLHDSEKEATGLTTVVPSRLEDARRHAGADDATGQDWARVGLPDGMPGSGQNPASSTAGAEPLLLLLAPRK